MTRERDLTVVVLCEDKQASTLLYRDLKHARGFKRVAIVPLPAATVGGCGSQYVRERYAAEVRKQRDRAVRSALVVHTDADNLTVTDRKQELARMLTTAGVPARQPDEPIALVVPRWETENWLHHYGGRQNVIETARYPKFSGREADEAKPTVDALVALVDGGAPAPSNLPSIGEAALELRRLP